jgi:alkanesulfonate monooxygenase SsuD/methylene tetrahydromethanopterin reductase-like flavin-dependent oxidoreductase (luciferase family)
LIGTPEEVARQLGDVESLGVARVILWPPLHDDLEMVNLIGREVLPAIISH